MHFQAVKRKTQNALSMPAVSDMKVALHQTTCDGFFAVFHRNNETSLMLTRLKMTSNADSIWCVDESADQRRTHSARRHRAATSTRQTFSVTVSHSILLARMSRSRRAKTRLTRDPRRGVHIVPLETISRSKRSSPLVFLLLHPPTFWNSFIGFLSNGESGSKLFLLPIKLYIPVTRLILLMFYITTNL